MRINKNAACILKSCGILLIFAMVFYVFMACAADDDSNASSEPDTAVAGAETEAQTGFHELDYIVIDNDVYEKDRKGPVTFGHRNHAKDYGISCWECHHDYVDGENTWSPWDSTMKCIECHDPAEDYDAIMRLQAAYHLNCKTCHKEQAVFGNDAQAYRKCTTCHERQ